MVKMGQNQTGFLCPAFNLNKLSPIRLRLAVISQCHWLISCIPWRKQNIQEQTDSI